MSNKQLLGNIRPNGSTGRTKKFLVCGIACEKDKKYLNRLIDMEDDNKFYYSEDANTPLRLHPYTVLEEIN